MSKDPFAEFSYEELKAHPETLSKFQSELQKVIGFTDTFERIESELHQFEGKLKLAHKENEFIDTKFALKIYSLACALLNLCKKSPFEKFVPYALAALSYFSKANDGKDDFTDIDGFEDDEKVLNLVVEHFNLQDRISKETNLMKIAKESQGA